MKIHISKGNMKMPKETLNFSLPPQVTCPKSTKECRDWCYANKAYRQYPNVKIAWNNNLIASKARGFYKNTIHKISLMNNWKQFRISQSGDFYNQSYLNQWIRIAKKFKDKTFYAYTKSHHLDFSKRSNNFIILLSDDKKEHKNKWNRFNGISFVQNEDIRIMPIDNIWTCLGNCRDCNICYKDNKAFKSVRFIKH